MHATSKLRALRQLQSTREQSSSSPTIAMPSRRDIQLTTKRSLRSSSATTDSSTSSRMDHQEHTTPIKWRRNSSAEIPIPSFMIPCSASSLMDMHYALSSSTESAETTYGQAISQR